MGSISSVQVPVTWPEAHSNISVIKPLNEPKKVNHWKAVELPKDNAFFLNLWNRLHFGQMHGTPFTVPPLSLEVDWAATSIMLELVLEGNYSNKELDDLQQMLLTHCKKEQEQATIGSEINLGKLKEKIRVWKENTTTSTSGKHLGHYNALLARGPFDPKSAEGKAFWSQQDLSVLVNVNLINYALKH
eukprot:10273641-Ditylum_brightwellii.AAC.1